MFSLGNQEFFAIYATFGFTGHVQVLVSRNMKIYKIHVQSSDNDKPWFFRPCKVNLFSLFMLTHNQLIKLHKNKKTKNKSKDYNKACSPRSCTITTEFTSEFLNSNYSYYE